MITSIESLSQKNNNEENKKLVFIGDEKGYVHVIEIQYDFDNKWQRV